MFDYSVFQQELQTGMHSSVISQSGKTYQQDNCHQGQSGNVAHPYSVHTKMHPNVSNIPYNPITVLEHEALQGSFCEILKENEGAITSIQQQHDGILYEVVSSTMSPVRQIEEPASSENLNEIHTSYTKICTRKRTRTPCTKYQIEVLEKEFSITNYLCPQRSLQLSNELKMSEKRVKVWFRNRRAKDQRKATKSKDKRSLKIQQQQSPKNKPENISSVHVSQYKDAGSISYRSSVSSIDGPTLSLNSNNNPLEPMQPQMVVTPPPPYFTPSSTSSEESYYYQNINNNQIPNIFSSQNNYDIASSYDNNVVEYRQNYHQQYKALSQQHSNQLEYNYYYNQYLYGYHESSIQYQDIPYQRNPGNPVSELSYFPTSEAEANNYNVPEQVSQWCSNPFQETPPERAVS